MIGVVLVDKPAGVTSHDVVASHRRRLGPGVRVGHAGTLDPFATGLLLLLVGRATRVQRFLTALPKTYRAVARLGWISDTGDRDGALTHTGRVPEAIDLPAGELMQRPPAYSAVKVGGERLYHRARRGDPAEGEPRAVTVHRSEVLWREDELVGLEIECSAGTYVRQLVAGLGDAYCEQLERTRIGPFRLEDADPERVVPLEEALDFLPLIALDPGAAERARHGVAVEQPADGPRGFDGPVRLLADGSLVAIAEPATGGLLKPRVVLAP
ncbi:MAG: tRNA pseudouridine(55) synthase TruB [Actinobacteria bacterium]|nr:tRNA pseudouridine(55) synthase TruB [Actinomycetota bacterium]